jgi:hypothetical protein
MICRINRRRIGLLKINIILLCVLVILTSKGILDHVVTEKEHYSPELNYREHVHHNRLMGFFSGDRTSTSSDYDSTFGEDSTYKNGSVKCNVTRKQLSKSKVCNGTISIETVKVVVLSSMFIKSHIMSRGFTLLSC